MESLLLASSQPNVPTHIDTIENTHNSVNVFDCLVSVLNLIMKAVKNLLPTISPSYAPSVLGKTTDA